MFNLAATIIELVNQGYEISFRKQSTHNHSSYDNLFAIKLKKDNDHIIEYRLDLEAMDYHTPKENEYEILKFVYDMKYKLEANKHD